MRTLTVGCAVVGMLLLLACGTTTPVCSATTCDGCCTADGQCSLSTTDSSCGRGGVACRACNAGEMCSFGSCVPTSFGSGGGSSGVGGGVSGGGSSGGGASGGGASGGGASGGVGGGSVFCGPSTCAGCCRSDGSCNLAPTNASCGSQGQLCRNCQASGQTCSSSTFNCVGAGGGIAGGAPGGGLAGGATSGGTAGGASAGGSANDNRLRLFLTATTFNGNLGGLTGADQRCQTAATAGNKGGTWVAFLASASATGLSRVSATGPWYQERADGTFLLTYNNTANLQTGALTALSIDEQGRTLVGTGSSTFWSGMNNDASTNSLYGHCSSWTSASGSGAAGGGSLLDSASASNGCSNTYRLLCLEQ